jgi:hypothetical protein
MGFEVPDSLKSAHDSIHATLKRAMGEPGRIGEAARAVARILDGHALREEKFALRPLGLLKGLAKGELPPKFELDEVVRLTEGLQRELPTMLDEHRQIAAAVRLLAQVATGEGKLEYVALAGEWTAHAQLEEDVLYPAALVIGAFARRLGGA